MTIQHIRLCSTGFRNPWDLDFKRDLEAIVALNRIGRQYVISDAANKAVGIKILEQVIDYSNCLFFLLRENPLLCYEEPHANTRVDIMK